MAWYDNLNPFGDDFFLDPDNLNRGKQAEELYGGVDPQGNQQRAAFGAERFGLQGQQGFGALGQEAAAERDYLRRLARGEGSMASEQLRQGLQANQATQMSMAAGARPSNAAMAARNASQNAALAGSGMAGQAAMAGLQEKQMAHQGLANMIGQQRGQDLQAALGGQQKALQGYGNIEQNRTERYKALTGAPTAAEQITGAATGIAGLFGLSDRRAKTDIEDGDRDAEEFLKGLKAYRYRYKDERNGKGDFVGPMAQDLERTKAGRGAVVETPKGKMVHGGRLALALAGAAGNLHKRLAKLEGKDE